jgi:hypothetical protein
MAWKHRFKPPSGFPAMGPGWGPGWGGPANGSGSPARPFTADSPTRNTGYGDRSPKRIAERKRLIAEQEERKEQMIEMLEGLALDPKTNVMVRIIAADKALDRLVGKPVVRTENQTASPSLEELIRATQTPKVVRRSRA